MDVSTSEGSLSHDLGEINMGDVERTYHLLGHQNETEIRIIEANKERGKVESKFINYKNDFLAVCKRYSGSRYNCYVGINERTSKGTKDDEVNVVSLYVFDIDPVRLKNTCSTSDELRKAELVADQISDFLVSKGFRRPSKGMSGNGYQLWLKLSRIELNGDKDKKEIAEKLKIFEAMIRASFQNSEVRIDAVHNLSRIMKIIGTKSVKGHHSTERPQRLSMWVFYDDVPGRDEELTQYIINLKVQEKKNDTEKTTCCLGIADLFNQDKILKTLFNSSVPEGERSEVEQSIVTRLVGKGFTNFNEIDQIMQQCKVGKWQNKSQQYRELTFQKAIEYTKPAKKDDTESTQDNNTNNTSEKKEKNTITLHTKSLELIRKEGFPQMKWRVDKLVPLSGITILGGSSGSYKTWAGMQLALACSSGTPFLQNFLTLKCNVLYVDEENGEITLPNRYEMLIKGHNLDFSFENLHVSIFNSLKLDIPTVVSTLTEIISKYNIGIIIIDSLVRCMVGEEDKAVFVRVLFENMKALLKKHENLSFVLLHHTKKEGSGLNSLRGSGDFAAFADVVLMFQTNHKRVVNVEVAKNRHVDLSNFSHFCFEILNANAESVSLNYVPFKEGNINVIDECRRDLLVHIREKELKAFSTAPLLKEMKTMGHKKNAYHAALTSLLDDNIIIKVRRGRYSVSQQIVEEVIETTE